MNQLRIFSKTENNAVLSTWLQIEQGTLSLQEDSAQPLLLTSAMLEGVFLRYGKPLEAEIPEQDWLGALEINEKVSVKAFRFLHFGDVYKTDYLGFFVADKEPLAAPAPLVTAALKRLALVMLRSR